MFFVLFQLCMYVGTIIQLIWQYILSSTSNFIRKLNNNDVQ